jgi:hypothetical protein
MRLTEEERDQLLWATAVIVQELVRRGCIFGLPDHICGADEVILSIGARIQEREEDD